MLQYAVYSLVLGLGLFDLIFLNSHLSIVALSYVFLRIQADISANRFLMMPKMDNDGKNPEPENYFAQIKIPKSFATPPREEKVSPNSESRKATLILAVDPKLETTIPKKNAPFEKPKFNGQAHEVLGIERDAATKVIQLAFRHWIKKYHPDHQKTEAREKATTQARRLQEAKLLMLERRSKDRQKSAA